MPGRILGLKTKEITGDWRKLHRLLMRSFIICTLPQTYKRDEIKQDEMCVTCTKYI
jgi:hypothetical protein